MLYSCSKFYNSSSDLHILERWNKTEQNRSHWIQIYSESGQQAIYLGNRKINCLKLRRCSTQYGRLHFHDSASPSHQDTALSIHLSNNALPHLLHKSNINVDTFCLIHCLPVSPIQQADMPRSVSDSPFPAQS